MLLVKESKLMLFFDITMMYLSMMIALIYERNFQVVLLGTIISVLMLYHSYLALLMLLDKDYLFYHRARDRIWGFWLGCALTMWYLVWQTSLFSWYALLYSLLVALFIYGARRHEIR